MSKYRPMAIWERIEEFVCGRALLSSCNAYVIEKAKSSAEYGIRIVSSKMESVKLSEKFDVVVMDSVLSRSNEPWVSLDVAYRALTHNGHLVVIEPNAESIHRRAMVEAGLMDDLTISDADLANGIRRWFTCQSLTAELSRLGFPIVKRTGSYYRVYDDADVAVIDALPGGDRLYHLEPLPDLAADVIIVATK